MTKVRARDKNGNVYVECTCPDRGAENIAIEWRLQLPDLEVEVVRIPE